MSHTGLLDVPKKRRRAEVRTLLAPTSDSCKSSPRLAFRGATISRPKPDRCETTPRREIPNLCPTNNGLSEVTAMILKTQASYPQSQSYVLKLHRDSSPAEGRLMGRLEHVASGRQLTFNTAEELIAGLANGFADVGAQEAAK